MNARWRLPFSFALFAYSFDNFVAGLFRGFTQKVGCVANAPYSSFPHFVDYARDFTRKLYFLPRMNFLLCALRVLDVSSPSRPHEVCSSSNGGLRGRAEVNDPKII